MKIDEVPQDKGYLVEGRISDLSYALNNDGTYTSKRSKGWQPKNEAMKLAWDMANERTENARQQVISGRLSPIAFYMELNLMDVKILAGYTGISRWKVKRHLKMKNFKKLKPVLLAEYAAVFKLTPAELTDISKIEQTKLTYED